jgi:hypothetical protein
MIQYHVLSTRILLPHSHYPMRKLSGPQSNCEHGNEKKILMECTASFRIHHLNCFSLISLTSNFGTCE